MKKYIFALQSEKAEKCLYRSGEAEMETSFPILLPISQTAQCDELINITLLISENSPVSSGNFLRLMTELKELAVKTGFRYDLTEIRIAGEGILFYDVTTLFKDAFLRHSSKRSATARAFMLT